MKNIFRPKLFDILPRYGRKQLGHDLMAGLIVGIVALPLAIAFAIASGVSPEKGLITAIVAGFLISALGGSRVQIGGPTGAFIVIVYGIVQQHGVNGLIIATLIAGIILIAMGLAGLGSLIKFIPHPLIVGFTSGIALTIFSSQLKDLLGLEMGAMPADFIDKWTAVFRHLTSINWAALSISVSTVLIILFWPRVTHKLPGSLLAILITTVVAWQFDLPVETIGSRFGTISASWPSPQWPKLDWETIKVLFQPAFTIALLAGIESLLSAVVADGMTGGNHRSNTELIAQGVANIGSAVFGGIPATGAIARTATNIKNGGRTPIAGIIHAICLFIILLFAGKWAAYIPLATLAGILVLVAYHMSEWQNFLSVLKGPRSDAAVLVSTFLLTVLIDLTVAIEVGMVLAAFLFMRKMIQFSEVKKFTQDTEPDAKDEDDKIQLPAGVEVFEIKGPLFFGAAYKFKDAMRQIEKNPKVLIVRMRSVPVIDATGIQVLKSVVADAKRNGILIILSELQSRQVMQALEDSGLQSEVGKENITASLVEAVRLVERGEG